MSFIPVSDQSRVDASVAITAAMDTYAKDSVEAHADLVSAGAALALERGAPRLIALNYDNFADDFLTQGSHPWRPFHGAVSRYIETDLNQSETLKSPGDGVGMVVSDVLQRVSAKKVIDATEIPEFREFLSPPQQELVDIARGDPEFRKDMLNIAVGSFESLSPGMSESLQQAFDTPLSDKLGAEVDISRRAVENVISHEEMVREKLEIHGDLLPQFSEISKSAMDQVIAYHSEGISTRSVAIDTAFDLLSGQKKVPEDLDPEHPMMIAQARLINDNRAGMTQNSSALAAMAITDAEIMSRANRTLAIMEGDDFSKNVLKAKATGKYHELDEDAQFMLEKDLVLANHTPALGKVRLEVDYIEKVGLASIHREVQAERDALKDKDQTVDSDQARKLIEAQRQSAALAQGMGY